MDSHLLKATAVAVAFAALAATAEAAAGSYIPSIATADSLLSPTLFLWVTANAIIIWLLSSSRRGGRTSGGDDAASSPALGGEAAMHDAADSLYTSSSEYEYFSDAGSARRAADALPGSRRMAAREARAARRADRPRVRKKPAGQDGAPSPRRAVASATREPDDERRGREAPVASFAAEPSRRPSGDGEDEDVSMDSLWQSIVQRRAARPVVVQKSESWGNEELPRLQRVAETTAAARREMRKSVSAVSSKTAVASAAAPRQPPSSALQQLGWRTRDVLEAIAPDELLRRAESFIRRQHEHLRLQRQESEQRQLQLQRRLQQVPALIRV